MPGYISQRQGTARTLPELCFSVYCLCRLCCCVYCLCVYVYCTVLLPPGGYPIAVKNHHYHHHKHQGLDPLIRSVSTVTTTLANVSSVFQLFFFLAVCSDMISKAFGLVAFFASVKISPVCIYIKNVSYQIHHFFLLKDQKSYHSYHSDISRVM